MFYLDSSELENFIKLKAIEYGMITYHLVKTDIMNKLLEFDSDGLEERDARDFINEIKQLRKTWNQNNGKYIFY